MINVWLFLKTPYHEAKRPKETTQQGAKDAVLPDHSVLKVAQTIQKNKNHNLNSNYKVGGKKTPHLTVPPCSPPAAAPQSL